MERRGVGRDGKVELPKVGGKGEQGGLGEGRRGRGVKRDGIVRMSEA